jgi:hypothetical protein
VFAWLLGSDDSLTEFVGEKSGVREAAEG